MSGFLVRIALAGIAVALILAPIALCAGGCKDTKPPVDVAAYTAESLACVNREETGECRKDVPACKSRIDACRRDVRARYGVAVTP